MRCPVCNVPMIIVEHERIELDYCTKCLGVWFDAGELELLIERLSLNKEPLSLHELWALPETNTPEKARRCPICRKKMQKAHVGEESMVLIDICPGQHGIWFDSGETSQVLSQLKCKGPATGKQGRVINFIGEVFKAK
ncbi:MAG: zf-TFIIB domain-containing protein [Dehalococcoidia bacterium]